MEKLLKQVTYLAVVAITLAQPGALATGAGAVFLGTGNFGLGIATLLVGPYAIAKAFHFKRC